MSELRDRLERLATRGSRRGADDVIRAVERLGPRDADIAEPMTDYRDLEIIDDLPTVTPDPARRRGRFATLIAATGVAALVAVGGLAVTAMFGSGGSDSPEAFWDLLRKHHRPVGLRAALKESVKAEAGHKRKAD